MSNLNSLTEHDCRCEVCGRAMSADIAEAEKWRKEYSLKYVELAGVYDKLESIHAMLPARAQAAKDFLGEMLQEEQ